MSKRFIIMDKILFLVLKKLSLVLKKYFENLSKSAKKKDI